MADLRGRIMAALKALPRDAIQRNSAGFGRFELHDQSEILRELLDIFETSALGEQARRMFPDGHVFLITHCAVRFQTPRSTANDLPFHFDDDHLEQMFGSRALETLATPRLQPSDALAFHQLILHRTQILQGPTKPRLSIEFRIAGRKAVPRFYCGRRFYVLAPDGTREIPSSQ